MAPIAVAAVLLALHACAPVRDGLVHATVDATRVIVVTEDGLLVDGRRVATLLADGSVAGDVPGRGLRPIAPLAAALASHRTTGDGVRVVASPEVSYLLVQRVLLTAGQAGYTEYDIEQP